MVRGRTGLGISLVVLASGLLLLGCGKPEVCKDQGRGGGLPSLVSKSWEPYCEELNTYLDEGNPDLVALTAYYANHPARVAEIKRKLRRYDRPERCYSEPTEQLEWKRLNECISTGPDMLSRMQGSFEAQAGYWLEESQVRLKKAKRLNDQLKRKSDHSQQKLKQKFQLHAPMDGVLLAEYTKMRAEYEKEVDAARAARELHEKVVKAASTEDMAGIVTGFLATPMTEFNSDLEKLESSLADYKKFEAFFQLANASVGKACPKGTVKNRKLNRLAKDMLADKVGPINMGKDFHLNSEAEESKKGPVFYETFTGHVCAERGEANQFEDQPKLCSTWTFTIQRQRADNVDEWEDWAVVAFEEDGSDGGFDCTMKK